MPAELCVFSRPGPTALNRTWESLLKLFARKQTELSSAAFTGAI